MSERIILCEGFYDRAFWAGWLEHLGCPEPPHNKKVFDPRGRLVERGNFGYYSPTGGFIRIVPCHSYDNILPAARTRIKDRRLDEVSRLVLCVDPDLPADGTTRATGLRPEDLLHQVRQVEPGADRNADGDIELDGAETTISLVRWEVPDGKAPGVPGQQTLERLVCAALTAAYPARGPAVESWLAARPQAPSAGAKEYAWSHMAGWYARCGCDAFYRTLWSDSTLVVELESRLRASGAWRIAEALAV